MDQPVTRQAATFRPEIEGLRGLAVLVVVLYHAGLAGVGGGFVGVDVFFVLSGFLITGLLLRERRESGRVSLARFYARRVRRLVPAAAVVLVATLVAAAYLVDPLSRVDVALDGAAAALSVGNLRFALEAGDYFAAEAAPSPFLQFWSLGVEEQFYLAWPLLLLVALRARWPRLAAGVVVAAVVAGSWAANLLVTEAAPAWAFYSLPTRAWQLGLGGMLAIAALPLARLPGPPLAVVGWAGVAAVLAASVLFDPGMRYPGEAALVPALGAAAILLGVDRPGGPRILLGRRPLRFLGRISYSLYLWHWPVLVLAPAAAGRADLPPEARLGLVGLAVGLATATCLLVEEPFRFGFPENARRAGARRTGRPRLAIAAGLATIVALASGAGGLSVAATLEVQRLAGSPAASSPAASTAPPLALSTAPPAAAPPAGAPAGGPAPAAPMAPQRPAADAPAPQAPSTQSPPPGAAPSPSADTPPADGSLPGSVPPGPPGSVPVATPGWIAIATPAPTPAVTSGPAAAPASGPTAALPPGRASGPSLPADVSPPLLAAASDEERLKADRCIAYEHAMRAPDCLYGRPSASVTVALVGDSHGAHWFPALEALAVANDWRIAPFVKVSCPFMDMAVTSRVLNREYTECAAFREDTLARLAALRPDLTIVAQNKWLRPLDPADARVARAGAALGRTLLRVPGPVAILVDNPHAAADVPTCLAAHPDEIGRCATPRARAMSGVGAIERAAAGVSGASTIDLARHVCVADPCPAVVDRMIVYRDYHHLTATFSRSLAPALGAALGSLVGG